MPKITSMRNTSKALDDYDASPTKANERTVAAAFAAETSAFNDPATCMLLRPGPAIPAPGGELSFIRRMVNIWREQTGRYLQELMAGACAAEEMYEDLDDLERDVDAMREKER